MNNVILIGRLATEIDMNYTPNTQTAKATFTLAVDRPKKEEQSADFIRIIVWGKQAENCSRYIDKGKQVAVLGHIQTGSYKKDGQTVYTTDVVADRVEFLGSRAEQKPREDFYDLF